MPFFEGMTLDWLGVGLELELELDESLDPEPDGGRHGGTIKVVTLLFAGRTSWSCGEAPACEVLLAPPGVIRIVLAGGGAIVGLLLELELESELLELDEPHASIATVCVSVLLGITISLEPGGMVLVPD